MRLAELGEISKETSAEAQRRLGNERAQRNVLVQQAAKDRAAEPARLAADEAQRKAEWERQKAAGERIGGPQNTSHASSEMAPHLKEHTAEMEAKAAESKPKPKVKVPKMSGRTGAVVGGVTGLGALTTGAAAMHAKRARDATG